jgi:hypothetical protein
MPFTTTYFGEAGFSVLVDLKSKKRNWLEVKDDKPTCLDVTTKYYKYEDWICTISFLKT